MNNLRIPASYVSVLLFSSSVLAASEPQFFDRALPVAGPVALEINTSPGGIKITQGSEHSVRIHAVVRPLYGRFDLGLAEASIRALLADPPIEQIGSHIRIGYKHLDELRMVSMTVQMEIPKSSEIRAQTTSGGINISGSFGTVLATTMSGHTDIENVDGRTVVTSNSGGVIVRKVSSSVSVRTKSGGIQITSIEGDLTLESQSGRIEARDISGGVQASAHAGSISIDNVIGGVTAANTSGSIDAVGLKGAVHAETKSGAIHIAQAKPAPIRALAQSGAITVDLARRYGYTIDAQSGSGKVSAPVARNTAELTDAHRFQQPLAGGGPLVDLDTRSSKIEIN